MQIADFQRKHHTSLITLLFSDIVGSTQLKQEFGDHKAVAIIQRHHALLRGLLRDFPGGEEIDTSGDSFFLIFAKPSDAVVFALLAQSRLRTLSEEIGRSIYDRMGIHVGEVCIAQQDSSKKPKDYLGIQVDICARVMSLGQANQILMTRFAFDNARQVLRGQEVPGLVRLSWMNHGAYVFKGINDPIEIGEVGEQDYASFMPPPDTDKAQRSGCKVKPSSSTKKTSGYYQEEQPGKMSAPSSDLPVKGVSIAEKGEVSSRKSIIQARLHHIRIHRRAGWVIAILFVLIEWWMGHTEFGQWLHAQTGDWLHAHVASNIPKVPITIIDINYLQTENEQTPRSALRNLMVALADYKPSSIGVDIDLSPELGQLPTLDTMKLFETCLDLKRKQPFSIYLGIRRSESFIPEARLGRKAYVDLAASISRPEGVVRTLPAEFRFRKGESSLPTLSKAMSSAYLNHKNKQAIVPTPPPWLAWATSQFFIRKPASDFQDYQVTDFFVDYTAVNQMMAERFILKDFSPSGIISSLKLLEEGAQIKQGDSALFGKMVFIGDATPGKATDTGIIPGQKEPIPGVYVHACGAYTLAAAPFYVLNESAAIIFNLMMALLAVQLIYFICSKYAVRAAVNRRLLNLLLTPAIFLVYYIIWTVVLLCSDVQFS